jgi:hypothetical protein
MRRMAVDFAVPLLTNLQVAELFTSALATRKVGDLKIRHWAEYE